MGRIEKTVFISYRRTNLPWALFIYQNLTMHGYDVFFDYESIDSGDFESVILNNIRARAHFIVVLTSSALENCKNSDDWLRREIETAMDEKRNIVPLMVENFDFGSPLIKEALTGKLSKLSTYNGLPVPNAYALEAMERLRERYLNKALTDIPTQPLQLEARKITESQKAAASEAAPVQDEQLTAQTWFERGYTFGKNENFDEAIRCYTEAIRLEPNYPNAYSLRGDIRGVKGDLEGAIKDHNKAIQLDPNIEAFYILRAETYKAHNNFESAIADYTTAIKLNPDRHDAYWFRGIARRDNRDFDGAIVDLTQVILLDPNNATNFSSRGIAYSHKGNLGNAIKDYNEAIRLEPDFVDVYYNRAKLWEGEKKYSTAIADYQKYLDLGGGIRDGDQKDVEEKIKKLKSRLTKKKSVKKKPKK